MERRVASTGWVRTASLRDWATARLSSPTEGTLPLAHVGSGRTEADVVGRAAATDSKAAATRSTTRSAPRPSAARRPITSRSSRSARCRSASRSMRTPRSRRTSRSKATTALRTSTRSSRISPSPKTPPRTPSASRPPRKTTTWHGVARMGTRRKRTTRKSSEVSRLSRTHRASRPSELAPSPSVRLATPLRSCTCNEVSEILLAL
mmetsp:Transcript_28173/g.64815  ORF Transcript_28173/g.64815 Transcript_28173/m.64815 type:complete len:206 (-) Transcript_28173:227-844(-)